MPPDLWPVDVDEAQIAQAVHNLILNAREAATAGGTVRLEASNVMLDAGPASDLPPGEYVRLRATDTGAGIAADVLPKIFDPYFSTKQRGSQKGMGLGLTICRTVFQKHNGAIAVESRPGHGTTVTCHLPAKRAEP
jgi:signal transduction histidine kinase